MRFIIIFFLLFASIHSFGQPNDIKFGVGAQVFEPTGLTLQFFRGFYNNNNSSFATYGVVELGVGKENMLGIMKDENKVYAGGHWTEGGLRVDLNYLYPLMTVHSPFVLQTYVGAGLQTGNRNYIVSGKEESQFATGMNLMLRLEYVTHGIDLGRAVWFFSIYGDVKYHADFTEKFDYISPVAGIRLRKGR
jgi:hypothetical protein